MGIEFKISIKGYDEAFYDQVIEKTSADSVKRNPLILTLTKTKEMKWI